MSDKLDISQLGELGPVNDNDRIIMSRNIDGQAVSLSIEQLKAQVINPLVGEGSGSGGDTSPTQLSDLSDVDTAFSTLGNGKYLFEKRNGIFYPAEAPVVSTPDPASLGELRNMDWSFDYIPEGKYLFEKRGTLFYPVEADTPVAAEPVSLGTLTNVSDTVDHLPGGTYVFEMREGMLHPVSVDSLGGGDSVPTQLGELSDVDDSFSAIGEGKYLFEKRGDTFYPVEAGNLGASTALMILTLATGEETVVSYGDCAIIRYNFSSTIGGQSTGAGTATYRVNDKILPNQTIRQGENSFDAGTYLKAGKNEIRISVTDAYENTRSVDCIIQAINLVLSSNFNAAQINRGSISYRYTPMGDGLKTVHFLVDGREYTEVTEYSNRERIYELPAQSHGNHTLEVYMTANVNGTTLESNHLYYELICVEANNMTPVIASAFNQTTAEQYSTIRIPYVVYDPNPASSVAKVKLWVNNREVSELEVPPTEQTWTYRLNSSGETTFAVSCGNVKRDFPVYVAPSEIQVTAETTGLQLFLTSMGRHPLENEATRDKWSFSGNGETIAATMENFNWGTNGWLPDGENGTGNMTLRLTGNARVTIPLKVFSEDIRKKGKTIEIDFSTANVNDFNAPVIQCWDGTKGFKITAQQALFKGNQNSVSTQFKEDERIRISFVVESNASLQNRLIYSYINGVLSGVVQYPAEETFTHERIIELGSNLCTLNVYNIRVYDGALNQYQILDNYIADLDDLNKKIEVYTRNRVYDSSGQLDYNLLVKQIPIMTFIGTLPNYKGDKKKVTTVYEDFHNPEKSFVSYETEIDVQGTSSQFYPRKNYKTKHKNGFLLTRSNEQVSKYALRQDSIPVSTFCQKADFAESSGTHNTGLAKIVEKTLRGMDILTPPQTPTNNVRTTVDGFPILVFHQVDEAAPRTFIGKYNFNNDKSTSETFGFDDQSESWEFRNNTTERVLFERSDYTDWDNQANMPAWLNDFEARHPDNDELNAQYKSGTLIPENLKRVTDWIVSCKNNPVKFKAEVENYFNKENLLSYYLLTELFGMVDQRAKNMFITTWDNSIRENTIWYWIFYDNDTCLGIDNVGKITFPYNIEDNDRIEGRDVWNGSGSTLWKNVEQAFSRELTQMYCTMRNRGILSYEKVHNEMNVEQSDKWCEAVYNNDGMYKYVVPLTDGFINYEDKDNPVVIKTGSFLYALQGNRSEHRKWWLFNRFKYMDSKYGASGFTNDYVSLRLNTRVHEGEEPKVVPPHADFTLTPHADQYISVQYGSYGTSVERAYRDVPQRLIAPNIGANDTETQILGASRLSSIGDVSDKYPGKIDISQAIKLRELIIGNDTPGYINLNFDELTVGSNKMLRKIDIRNCPNLKHQSLDLSLCDDIEEVYAEGSGITAVNLPAGGNLHTLHLPGTIASLVVKNQVALTDDGFWIESVDNLTHLVLEHVNFDVFALLERCLSIPNRVLNRVGLVGIHGTLDNSEILGQIATLKGVDNGEEVSRAVAKGRCHIRNMYADDLGVIEEMFPELIVTYDRVVVRFADEAVKLRCIEKFDIDQDGSLTPGELLVPTSISRSMFDSMEITSFNEFGKYFKNVTKISYYAFKDCTIQEITFPDSLQLIEQNAFLRSGLVEAHLPDSVSTLESGVFENSKDLKKFTARGVGGTISNPFRNCTALTDVVLTGNYTAIGSNGFRECTSLVNVTLADTCRSFGSYCFEKCAFTNFRVPPFLVSMGGNAFYKCEKLETIELPETLEAIGGDSFRDCRALREVVIHAETPPTLGSLNTFSGTLQDQKIYVPHNSVDAYKAAPNWSNYANRIYSINEKA